jgi:hypothetical protein
MIKWCKLKKACQQVVTMLLFYQVATRLSLTTCAFLRVHVYETKHNALIYTICQQRIFSHISRYSYNGMFAAKTWCQAYYTSRAKLWKNWGQEIYITTTSDKFLIQFSGVFFILKTKSNLVPLFHPILMLMLSSKLLLLAIVA